MKNFEVISLLLLFLFFFLWWALVVDAERCCYDFKSLWSSKKEGDVLSRFNFLASSAGWIKKIRTSSSLEHVFPPFCIFAEVSGSNGCQIQIVGRFSLLWGLNEFTSTVMTILRNSCWMEIHAFWSSIDYFILMILF